jgi:hypothetical protein
LITHCEAAENVIGHTRRGFSDFSGSLGPGGGANSGSANPLVYGSTLPNHAARSSLAGATLHASLADHDGSTRPGGESVASH